MFRPGKTFISWQVVHNRVSKVISGGYGAAEAEQAQHVASSRSTGCWVFFQRVEVMFYTLSLHFKARLATVAAPAGILWLRRARRNSCRRMSLSVNESQVAFTYRSLEKNKLSQLVKKKGQREKRKQFLLCSQWPFSTKLTSVLNPSRHLTERRLFVFPWQKPKHLGAQNWCIAGIFFAAWPEFGTTFVRSWRSVYRKFAWMLVKQNDIYQSIQYKVSFNGYNVLGIQFYFLPYFSVKCPQVSGNLPWFHLDMIQIKYSDWDGCLAKTSSTFCIF